MKLRCPDFARSNLHSIMLSTVIPLHEGSSELLKRIKARKARDLTIDVNKKRKDVRFQIGVSPDNKDGVGVLEDILNYVKDTGASSTAAVFQCIFTYEGEDYVTDPVLPIEMPEDRGKKGTILLTGVKLNFNDPSSSLRYAVIDMRYCPNCDKYHDIANYITFRKDIPINANFLIHAVKIAKQYSETFVKLKGN